MMLPVETEFFNGVAKKAFQGPLGRVRCSRKINQGGNEGLSPGVQCLIHNQAAQLSPTAEEVRPCLHKAQKKGQGPEILGHWPGIPRFQSCWSSVYSAPKVSPTQSLSLAG